MDMSVLLTQLAMLAAVAFLGFIAGKCGVMNLDANRMISRIVLDITLPCSILYSVLSGERLLDKSRMLLTIGLAAGSAVLLILFANLIVKVFRIEKSLTGVCKFTTIFTNAIFFGFPLIRSLYGSNALFIAVLFNMLFMILSYSYGAVVLSAQRQDFHFHWRSLLTPAVITSVIAFILYQIDFTVPELILKILGNVDQITSPLSMLSVGCALAFVPVGSMFRYWRLYGAVSVRMVVIPILWILLLRLLGVSELMIAVTAILIAMPAPASTTMFCARFGGDQTAASCVIFYSTIFAILSIPVIGLVLIG